MKSVGERSVRSGPYSKIRTAEGTNQDAQNAQLLNAETITSKSNHPSKISGKMVGKETGDRLREVLK